MTHQSDSFDELGQLLAELCDGQLEPDGAARLEHLASQSDAARQYFLEYMYLHGELHWDRAAQCRPATCPANDQPPTQPVSSPVRRSRWLVRHPAWVVGVLAGSLLVAMVWSVMQRDGGGPPPAAVAARLVGTYEAVWTPDGAGCSERQELLIGQTVSLQSGLAEFATAAGTRVLLEGPAQMTVDGPNRITLATGTATARVPAEAAGFALVAPMMTVVDHGTEFGVEVRSSERAEVHCFEGEVEVQRTHAGGIRPFKVAAGEATDFSRARLEGSSGWASKRADASRFVRHLPAVEAGSVAQWRRMAAAHPRLIHHYTFEGRTRAERFNDRRGELHLRETVMGRGSSGGSLGVGLRGIDASTRALAIYPASPEGNMLGVGLVSEDTFLAPPKLTVELLLRLDLHQRRDDRYFGAVATRASRRDCGFVVMAGGDGQLGHLFDGDAAWTEPAGEPVLRPVIGTQGDWFYVATTCAVADGQTLVNTYLANVSRREASLRRVVRDMPADGRPADGHLAIGCAFDDDLAHAYPWQGALDEIAIYDTVLDEGQLNQHLQAILGGQTP